MIQCQTFGSRHSTDLARGGAFEGSTDWQPMTDMECLALRQLLQEPGQEMGKKEGNDS